MTLLQALITSENAKNVTEARELIRDMQKRLLDNGEDPEELLLELGLEPDYVMELISCY